MLDHFIYGLEPIVGHEVLKENPQTFEKAFVLTERIQSLGILIGGVSTCSKFRWLDLPDYAPIDLDSMGTWERHRQPDKGGRYNQNNILAQPALFLARRATFPEIIGINHLNNPVLMMTATSKGTKDALHALQDIAFAPRHPTNRVMLLMQNLKTTK